MACIEIKYILCRIKNINNRNKTDIEIRKKSKGNIIDIESII
jgi:hypothetical protein